MGTSAHGQRAVQTTGEAPSVLYLAACCHPVLLPSHCGHPSVSTALRLAGDHGIAPPPGLERRGGTVLTGSSKAHQQLGQPPPEAPLPSTLLHHRTPELTPSWNVSRKEKAAQFPSCVIYHF